MPPTAPRSTSATRVASTVPAALIFIAGVFIAGAGVARADVVRKSFDVAPGGKLTVDTDRGSIEVRASGAGKVDVEVTREGSEAEDLKLDFAQSGNDVTVRGTDPRAHGGFNFNWGNRSRVRFVITVPSRYDVDLETAGGSVSVDDLEGSARTTTSGGGLRFGHIRGAVWGRTSGGSISLQGGSADADVKTSGGSIDIGEVDGEVRAETSGGSIHVDRARGSVHAETSGGGIRVDEVMGAIEASTSGGSVHAYISQQPAADCRLSTSGGGVEVQLGPGVAVDVDASASGGRVVSDVDLSDERKTRGSLKGKLNGGGPELRLRSSGGSVRISRG